MKGRIKMRNIIKAQLYQFVREKIPFFVFAGLIALHIFSALISNNLNFETNEPIAASTYVTTYFISSLFTSVFIIPVTVGPVCCGDFADKTSHYEILSGHLRRHIFFGRSLMAILIAVTEWVIITVVPVIMLTAMNGWGTDITVGDAVFRLFLMIFPVIRMCCEFVMLSFIIKNPYIIMAGGYVIIMLGEMLANVTQGTGWFFTSATNLMQLGLFDFWVTYGLSDGTNNFIYDAVLPTSDIILTLAISITVSIGALAIGYIFFKNDDLN